jgi:beta-lactamase regulating signal transducer with metallopeptidase domain
MTDIFFQIGLSNVCVAFALAIIALVVEATAKRPQLAHLLWLLVFVKLLTPPVVTIPVVAIGGLADNSTVVNQGYWQIDIDEKEVSTASNISAGEAEISPLAKTWFLMLDYGKTWLPPIWLLGMVVMFVWSMVRIFRFNRLLTLGSEIAPQKLQTVATGIANRLGLKSVPAIHTTSAPLSPMVWWLGGKVRIVIPTVLLEQMDTQQFEWVMAHELAHVCRRDYLVRWIEWLACICFWWNPLVWWARRHLRTNEEICCDALVVSSLQPEPHSYANSLLTAIEYLACPVLRPPAIASEINSGGFLERRFKMIVSENLQRKNAIWLQVCVLLLAAVVLPLSVVYAQDSNAKTDAYLEQVWAKLQVEVEAGNMSAEDAEAKMTAIKKQKCGANSKTDAYLEQVWDKLQAQVEDGSLTAEDAETMMIALKKKYDDQANRAKYEAVAMKIRAAIESGRITEEEGREKLGALRKSIGEHKRKEVDWDGIKRRIEGAVERGVMTREEADAKYAEIKKRMAHGDIDAGLKKRYAIAEKQIKAAIEAGEITEEQGKERFAKLRERLAHAAKKGGKGQDIRARYAAAVEKIKAAVEAGEITEAEADEKIAGLRRRIGAARGRGKKDVDWEAIKQRIEGAVERGVMTREEADAKYAEIKKRMAQGDRDDDHGHDHD